MKTERRHELQHNALADWLADQIERLRPYSRLALGILVAAVVAVGLYGYLANQTERRSEEGWQSYYTAIEAIRAKGDVDPLSQLATSPEFATSAVGYWAMLRLADYHLEEGITQLFNDRPAANATLHSALDEYTRVSKQTKFPALTERATLGVARVHESLNELDKARSAYEVVASKQGSPFAADAQARLNDLQQDPTRRFYDWFFAVTPPKQGLGGPGMPGLRPDFSTLPDEKSFAPPAEGEGLLKSPKPQNESTTEPAGEPRSDAPAEPPTGEAPATPAGEQPAAPSTEAPSTEAPATPPTQPGSASTETPPAAPATP